MTEANDKRKPVSTGQKFRAGKLSLYPLSIEDAIRGAAQTGPPPGKAKRIKKPKPSKVEHLC